MSGFSNPQILASCVRIGSTVDSKVLAGDQLVNQGYWPLLISRCMAFFTV